MIISHIGSWHTGHYSKVTCKCNRHSTFFLIPQHKNSQNTGSPSFWGLVKSRATSLSEKLKTAGISFISLACFWCIGICANLPDFPDGENHHVCFLKKKTFYWLLVDFTSCIPIPLISLNLHIHSLPWQSPS